MAGADIAPRATLGVAPRDLIICRGGSVFVSRVMPRSVLPALAEVHLCWSGTEPVVGVEPTTFRLQDQRSKLFSVSTCGSSLA
jgi:hypothetical protein